MLKEHAKQYANQKLALLQEKVVEVPQTDVEGLYNVEAAQQERVVMHKEHANVYHNATEKHAGMIVAEEIVEHAELEKHANHQEYAKQYVQLKHVQNQEEVAEVPQMDVEQQYNADPAIQENNAMHKEHAKQYANQRLAKLINVV